MSEAIENATTVEANVSKGKSKRPNPKPKATTRKAKPAKAAKPKPEKKPKAPREDRANWQTFALRLPKSEAAALHSAAGPANASRAVRALIAAFVAEDRSQFEAVVEDCKKLR